MGLLADGTAGVAAGPDFPLQLQAQVTGIAAIGLFGFFAAWLFLMPLALYIEKRRRNGLKKILLQEAPELAAKLKAERIL